MRLLRWLQQIDLLFRKGCPLSLSLCLRWKVTIVERITRATSDRVVADWGPVSYLGCVFRGGHVSSPSGIRITLSFRPSFLLSTSSMYLRLLSYIRSILHPSAGWRSARGLNACLHWVLDIRQHITASALGFKLKNSICIRPVPSQPIREIDQLFTIIPLFSPNRQ